MFITIFVMSRRWFFYVQEQVMTLKSFLKYPKAAGNYCCRVATYKAEKGKEL